MNKSNLCLLVLSLAFLISGYFIIDDLTLLIVYYSVFGVIFVVSFTNFLGDLIQERFRSSQRVMSPTQRITPSAPTLNEII